MLMNVCPIKKDDNFESRRQNINPIYTPNGALYLIHSDKLNSPKSFTPEKCQGIEMDQISSIDLDDPIDWSLAMAVINSKLSWRDKLT